MLCRIYCHIFMNIQIKYFSSLVVLLGFTLCSATLEAQTGRLAYVNIQQVLSQLPDIKKADESLKTFRQQQQDEFEVKAKRSKELSDQLRASRDTLAPVRLSPLDKKAKERELSELSAQLLALELQGDQTLINKEKEMKGALLSRVQQAISIVATRNNYNGVMDMSQVIYFNPADDITPLVLKELNITVPR